MDATKAWRHLGDRFSGEHAQFSWHDGLTVVATLVAIAALYLLLRIAQRAHDEGWFASGPRALFFELCRAHKLDRRSRRLLHTMAAMHNIEAAALVFLLPQCLRDISGQLGTEDLERLAWLRSKLFDDEQQPEQSAACPAIAAHPVGVVDQRSVVEGTPSQSPV